ncbi:hypothetical protein HYPSUDRAFT_46130 [Hypholoma sublateritium FD-334 SS-4]|uniref:Uncharacterized protein n=1 Tax=Hypholoma sublateritium (strain FD-334 SS-4) TaxID=945553 RepID=A0A0D2NLV0_HYPSF|nr:hypothetical protein HYPSUDRAFT_46130 [Hypholoma sublateritium FD-334 SS-4]
MARPESTARNMKTLHEDPIFFDPLRVAWMCFPVACRALARAWTIGFIRHILPFNLAKYQPNPVCHSRSVALGRGCHCHHAGSGTPRQLYKARRVPLSQHTQFYEISSMHIDNLNSQPPAQSEARDALSPAPAMRNQTPRRRQPPAPKVTSHYANMSNFTIYGGNFSTVGGEVFYDLPAEDPPRGTSPGPDVPPAARSERAQTQRDSGVRISTFEGARNGTFSGGRFHSVGGDIVHGPQRASSPAPSRERQPDAADEDRHPHMPASFFQGAENVSIRGATFSEIQGDLTVYCHSSYGRPYHSMSRYGGYSTYSTGSYYGQYAGHAEDDLPEIIVVPPGDVPIYDTDGRLAGHRTPSSRETAVDQTYSSPAEESSAWQRHAIDDSVHNAYYHSARNEYNRSRPKRRGFNGVARAQSPQHWDEQMGRETLYGAPRTPGETLGRCSAPPRDDVHLGRGNIPGHTGRQGRPRPAVL